MTDYDRLHVFNSINADEFGIGNHCKPIVLTVGSSAEAFVMTLRSLPVTRMQHHQHALIVTESVDNGSEGGPAITAHDEIKCLALILTSHHFLGVRLAAAIPGPFEDTPCAPMRRLNETADVLE